MANPFIRTVIQLASAMFLAVTVVMTYCSLAERSAERKARDFCSTLQVGMSVESLESRALAAGASERQTKWIKWPDQDPWLPVTFTGAFPMSRHLCSIAGSPTLVKAEYRYLD